MKIEEKILNQLKALGYPIEKELKRADEEQLELKYKKHVKNYFIPPRVIGEVIDGKANYEAKLSAVKQEENNKTKMDFVGFTIGHNNLVEYYKNNNLLYVFLYEYRENNMERHLAALFIDTVKEANLDASIIQ